MIKVAICDDVQQDMNMMKRYIAESEKRLDWKEKCQVVCFSSGEAIVASIMANPEKYNVIIMDVQLGGMTGKEAVQKIRRINKNVIVCIMSRNELPVPADFRLNAYRYIMKDDSPRVILQDIKSILSEAQRIQEDEYMFFDAGEKSIKIEVKDILYISKKKRGSQLHILREDGTTNVIDVKNYLKDIQDSFKKFDFEYAHNSYMINYRMITEFMGHGKAVRLENDEILNISRSYKECFISGHAILNKRG